MVLLFLLFQFAYADEAPVVQVMDPMPIIAVDDVGKKLPEKSDVPAGEEGAAVDTEAPSPLAPQTFDGFGGVVQEPFSPTEREQIEIQKKQEEAAKRLAIARAAQEKKTMAAMLPKKGALPKKTGPKLATKQPAKAKNQAASKTTAKTKVVAKKTPAKPGKAVAKNSKAPAKRVPAADPKAKKPGALKVAPTQKKK